MPAAIIFTSGSTGPAKGVLFRHGNFDRQVTEIRDFYGIRPGEIDVSCFPLFGLFNAAMGVTSVIPAMDVTRPAAVDPRNIVARSTIGRRRNRSGRRLCGTLSANTATSIKFNCPACGEFFPVARRAAHVLKSMKACIHPDGEMHTPYGATEALPVASNSATAVLGETFQRTQQGAGVCVGKKFDGVEWRIIEINNGPIRTLADSHELPAGQIGELIVRGPVVTTEYVTRTDANAMAKIRDDERGGFWHRMGDVGYFDQQDRFWFCGRMSQRVTCGTALNGPAILFTIPCEAIFNRHPDVFRSALVGMGPTGNQTPAVVVEPKAGQMPRGKEQREKLVAELHKLAQSADHTAAIEHFFIREALPVDVRHNVKINREQLAQWAERKLRGRLSSSRVNIL